MRKVKLISILMLIVFIVSSCAPSPEQAQANKQAELNKVPIERKKSKYNDDIKFYGFDWLTEASVVLDKFNQDFGEDTYTLYKQSSEIEDTDFVEHKYYFKGKDDGTLDWIIADNKVKYITLYFISNKDSEKCYLTRGTLEFGNAEDVIEEVNSKLKKLYSYDKDTNWYRDINGNTILPILGMFSYNCGEISSYINDLQYNARRRREQEERDKEKEELKNQGL